MFIRHMIGSEIQLYNGILAVGECVYLSAFVLKKLVIVMHILDGGHIAVKCALLCLSGSFLIVNLL